MHGCFISLYNALLCLKTAIIRYDTCVFMCYKITILCGSLQGIMNIMVLSVTTLVAGQWQLQVN